MSTEVAPEPVGLRERKKRARRMALIDAAHHLVERDGLDGVTVDAICAEAGVSPRTFFNYFESKDDAVLGMEPLSLDPEVGAAFAGGGPTGDLVADLEVLARSVLVAPVMTRRRMAAAAELARREPRLIARHMAWMERYRTEVDELLRRRLRGRPGTVAPGDPEDALVELAGMTLMVMVRSAMTRWEAAGAHGEVADHLDAVRTELRMLVGAPPSSTTT
jgi:AcrR family transcriptional regulator